MLADLEQKQQQLAEVAFKIKQARDVKVPTAPAVRTKAFVHLGLTRAIEHFLRLVRTPQRVQEIVEALKRGGYRSKSEHPYNSVWVTLNQGREQGRFRRFGKLWGLAEWGKQPR